MGFNSSSRIAAAVLLAPLALGIPVLRADPLVIEGPAVVIDNSTVEIWGHRIRFSGIAAPDPESEGGLTGKRYLQDLLVGVRVQCRLEEPMTQTALSGRCRAASLDISEHLVQMGYARAIVDRPEPAAR